MSVNCVCPTLIGAVELYGELSLTVNLKFNVLATELNASDSIPASPPTWAVVAELAITEESLGKYLEGDTVGDQDRKFGPVVLVWLALLDVPTADPLWSFCSQQ